MTGRARDDRILPATRMLAGFIVPFLVAAFVVLYPVPSATRRWFAWEIKPSMTAMVLGSAYIGGAYFFVQVVRSRAWHAVKAGFVPVALFASSLGVTTILHWDRFNHDHVAFWLWSGLYFTTPLLVLAVWWHNRAWDPAPDSGDTRLPPAARYLVGAAGLAALALGVFAVLQPARAVTIWPWAVTELTARVMGSVLLLGVAGLGIYLDPRRTTSRLLLEVTVVMLVLMLTAAVRARDEFLTSRPLTWLLGIGLAGVLAGSVALLVHSRREQPGPPRTGQSRTSPPNRRSDRGASPANRQEDL